MTTLSFTVFPLGAQTFTQSVEIDTLVIAGWAGCDAAAIKHHVAELAALGVAPVGFIVGGLVHSYERALRVTAAVETALRRRAPGSDERRAAASRAT